MATNLRKSSYRYMDYYCYMSLADFNAFLAQDDDGDDSFSISTEGQGPNT